jgi:arylsulfatase A-like enzyme
MFPDNLGVGEVGSYGGARGVETPNIDRIAAEGIRLTSPTSGRGARESRPGA